MSPSRGPIRWLHRLGIRRVPPEKSVAWEIDHHLAETADRLIEEGWAEEDAIREAERRFGDRRRYGRPMRRMERSEAARARAARIFDFVGQAFTGVLRTARRYPGFTAGVVLTLALGIGANATMYGIIDRLLLRPPEHIVQPGQVRRVLLRRPFIGGRVTTQAALAYPDYVDLKAHEGMSVAGYNSRNEWTVGSGDAAVRVRGALASAEFFPLLGVQPRLGRFFTEEEAAIGSPLTVVVSEEYWRKAYGSDPDILGRTIEIDGDLVPIIGVAPAGFTGVELWRVDLWLPLEASQGVVGAEGEESCLTGRNCYWMSAVARLREAETVERAEAEATQLHRNARREQIDQGRYPETAEIVLAPLIAAAGPDPSGESRVAKWLSGVSLIVLLIACANVANLLLARGTRQRREIAVRLALGVDRLRLVGQMTFESVILALLGGGLALAIVRWGGGILRSTLLPEVYFPNSAMNGRVIAFTVLASVLAGLLAGLGPALQGSRFDLASDLTEGGRGNSPARSRLRGFLTMTQAAMSIVLLVGAGLFVRSLAELRRQDLGLDTDRLLMTTFFYVSDEAAMDPAIRGEVFDEATRRLASLPAVESTTGTSTPFSTSLAVRLRVPGLDSIPQLAGGGPYLNVVKPGFFRTAGLSISSGRPIDETDVADAPRVVVVSETMARTLWPGKQAIGECVLIGTEPDACTTVVGVVEDALRSGYQDRPFMAYYLAMGQVADVVSQGPFLSAPQGLYIRAAGRISDAKEAVTSALRSISPQVRWTRVSSFREMLDPQARSWTLGATMFTVFGALALLLAGIGLYGVLAFDVAQRTREIGIRTALGAARGRVLRGVVAEGTKLAGIGVALGLIAAVIAAPYAADLLFHVSPRDPWVLGLAGVTLFAVGILASLAPGLRATRVDPQEALRGE